MAKEASLSLSTAIRLASGTVMCSSKLTHFVNLGDEGLNLRTGPVMSLSLKEKTYLEPINLARQVDDILRYGLDIGLSRRQCSGTSK